ncbi:MAG: SAM-dependent methyltransferase, partial [Hyphomicrobiaceae bacterium]|nr:SAM-dependent methyltransferase [Hyphomicrobiaceae bacterium]
MSGRRPDPLPYDPEARRDTPLALKLKERIRREGTLSLPQYMAACLGDREHGYYSTRQPIGTAGDFVTAPEISQTFGELLGLWCAVVWQQLGAPSRFRLIELGPGRGTLLRDALRAARLVPGFLDAAQLSLVEIGSGMRAAQQAALEEAPLARPPQWYDSVTSIYFEDPAPLDEPAIVIGNEFLDTAPVFQFLRHEDGWVSRRIGLDSGGRLTFTDTPSAVAPRPLRPRPDASLDALFPSARPGEIVTRAHYELLDTDVVPFRRVAALFIDYGHDAPVPGDTLQAVRAHAPEHPLTSPGEADLTAQVDFSAIGRRIAGHGAGIAVDGPVT